MKVFRPRIETLPTIQLLAAAAADFADVQEILDVDVVTVDSMILDSETFETMMEINEARALLGMEAAEAASSHVPAVVDEALSGVAAERVKLAQHKRKLHREIAREHAHGEHEQHTEVEEQSEALQRVNEDAWDEALEIAHISEHHRHAPGHAHRLVMPSARSRISLPIKVIIPEGHHAQAPAPGEPLLPDEKAK